MALYSGLSHEERRGVSRGGLRDVVCEVTGLDGRFCLPERVVQKLWLRREFCQQATLLDGRAVVIHSPGKWNLRAGPDFHEAIWSVDGVCRQGAVEIHARQADWIAHGHQLDPAYDAVGLHVVLFPPGPEEPPIRTLAGNAPDVLVLLPLLRCGLEELAEADALAGMTGRDFLGLSEEWAGQGIRELQELCRANAQRRWARKVVHALERLRRFGWEEACHGAALEVLGYQANRAAMASLSARWSLQELRARTPTQADMMAYSGAAWCWKGVRPANRPDARLAQYLAWVAKASDWPLRLQFWAQELERTVRRALTAASEVHASESREPGGLNRGILASDSETGWGGKLSRRPPLLRTAYEQFFEEVCARAVSGSRLHNLVVDLALPFAAAASGDEGSQDLLGQVWMDWWPADGPAEVRTLVRAGALAGSRQPLTNGLVQGVLEALLERRAGVGPGFAAGVRPTPAAQASA